VCLYFSLQLLSETLFILRRIERDILKKNVYWPQCKVPVILVRFLRKLEFSRQILEKYPDINFFLISPVAAKLFHLRKWTDGRTDRTMLIVASRKFTNAPKKESLQYVGS
jgi:hypothetical protein